jgi:hypothetical protein
VHRGVYAVGRRELSQRGRWIAAVLACGEGAALSRDSAAEFWRLAKANRREQGAEPDAIHVSVLSRSRSRDGIKVHRRRALNAITRDGIRVTTPAQTLIDVAGAWDQPRLEQAIGEADLRRTCSLRTLRTAASKAGRPGAALRSVIERLTFRVTQSELERELLRLIVEADGARFHANAVQQMEDRRRDNRPPGRRLY